MDFRYFGKITKMKIPVYSIKVPRYSVKTKPNWDKFGEQIDKLIIKKFLGKNVAIRCLGSMDHSGKSLSQLISIIKKIGHDRYDPNHKGDRYENVENKKIDIFCLPYKITPKVKIMGNMIKSFYVYPIKVGVKPTRLDIILIYDRKKLKQVLHHYKGKDDAKIDGFVFKNPKDKRDALLGIIKIL